MLRVGRNGQIRVDAGAREIDAFVQCGSDFIVDAPAGEGQVSKRTDVVFGVRADIE